MKRVISVFMVLVMILCVVPTSAFAANTKYQLDVVENRAPIREKPQQEGKVLERHSYGDVLECVGRCINFRLHIWYRVKCKDGSIGFIYSGNVNKHSDTVVNCGAFSNQVEMSRDFLSKQKCLEAAEMYKDTGYSKTYVASEIYAHAIAYYVTTSVLNEQVKAHVTSDLLCKACPGICEPLEKVVDSIMEFADNTRNSAVCVDIGEDMTTTRGITYSVIFAVLWYMPEFT